MRSLSPKLLTRIRLNGVCVGGMKRERAFTLIELLVVIAIIAVLASMLLPVVSRAKNNASKATDLNNLKEIMVALHVYTSDSADVLPPPNWDAGYYPGAPVGWLYAPTNDPPSGPTRFRAETGLFWSTLKTPKIYVCPMDNVTQARPSQILGATVQREQQLSSYAMNGAVTGYDRQLDKPVRLSAMKADDCAYWETDEREPFYFNDGANNPSEGVSSRHHEGGIQATFSGTVNYIRLSDWYTQEQDPNRNRLWCFPESDDGH